MKKYILSVLAVVLVAALGLFAFTAATPAPAPAQTVAAFPLGRSTLADTVDVPGRVQSQSVTKIYSTLAYPALNLAVAVGDDIKEGDLLCQLDTQSLELSIQQQSSAISKAQSQAQHSLQVAQNNLDNAAYDKENNYNSGLLTADANVDNAEAAVKKAENALQGANLDLSNARKDLRDARDDEDYYPSDDDYDSDIQRLRRIVSAKEVAVEGAQQAVESAKQGLKNAKSARNATEVAAREQLQSHTQNITSAKLSGNFSDQWIAVQKLQLDLEKATIVAPISGVVTAVNVSEGAPASGLLFVIEDTSRLEVVAEVDEYDVIHLEKGAAVDIRPDADESTHYTGSVVTIAPTPARTPTGDSASDRAAYETKAAVDSTAGTLRVGMHVRMNITTQERPDAFSVPYAALTKNTAGEHIVLVVRTDEQGNQTAQEVPVRRGLETERLVEISSDLLAEGDLVLSSVQGIHGGDPITAVTPE